MLSDDPAEVVLRQSFPGLPPPPASALSINLDNLRSCYIWAIAMVQLFGEAAWRTARAEKDIAIASGNMGAVRGWEMSSGYLRPLPHAASGREVSLDRLRA